MAWVVTDQRIVLQAIASTDTVQNHPYGTIVKARDSTFGAGEFIYLQGVTGGFTGALVTYVTTTGVTELTKTSGVVRGGAPLAVMMSALDAATKFGWFQIEGDATVFKTAVKFDPATNSNVYLSATAGRIMQTSVAGRQVLGARWTSAVTVTSTTSTAVITLNRPTQKSGTAI